MLLDTLALIAEELNRSNITWAVGASLLLHHHGLEQQPNDIDLLIDLQDIEPTLAILDQLGHREALSPKGVYTTKHFHEYVINGTDVDVMAGFGIRHENGVFTYDFSEASIVGYTTIGNTRIPLTSLEDWLVLYPIMSGREHRVHSIENHLISKGTTDTDRLAATLKWTIPESVKDNIRRFIADTVIDPEHQQPPFQEKD